MIPDVVVGGVLIPALLILAILALSGAMIALRLLKVTGISRLFAHWPLVELSVFAALFSLLVQAMISVG